MAELPDTTRAAVAVAPQVTQVRSLGLPPPDELGAILRIEAAGVCGSDVNDYRRIGEPRILGHENAGRIVALGRLAGDRLGLSVGDRILLEEYLPCGRCRWCRSGRGRLCPETDTWSNPHARRYGSTPLATDHGLWGGFSQYLPVHPHSMIHRLPSDLPTGLAPLAIPLSNGYEWAGVAGGVGPGCRVVILGPGQQGLSCLVAARLAGADRVVVVGRDTDEARLELAGSLGARVVVTADGEPAAAAVERLTGPDRADVVIDVAAGDEHTLGAAVEIADMGGTLVVAAPSTTPPAVDVRGAIAKNLTVRFMRGHSYAAVEWALGVIRRDDPPVSSMSTRTYGLDDVDRAIRATGGADPEPVLHATIVPD